MAFHSGFVCILGRPNAGKSTLLNALVGEKLAIISSKPQTTRNRILGIVHLPAKGKKGGGQIVLIDTPGVHKPDSSLGRKMMIEVKEALEGCDLVLLITDANHSINAGDQFVLDMAKYTKTPVFLLLNKIDLLKDKAKLLPMMEAYRKLHAVEGPNQISDFVRSPNLDSVVQPSSRDFVRCLGQCNHGARNQLR